MKMAGSREPSREREKRGEKIAAKTDDDNDEDDDDDDMTMMMMVMMMIIHSVIRKLKTRLCIIALVTRRAFQFRFFWESRGFRAGE